MTTRVGVAAIAAAAICAGCNPATTAIKVGMHVVGPVIDSAETKQVADQLLGQEVASADAQLGPRLDTLQDVNSPRAWLTYPVPMDVLDTKRYVVEAVGPQVVGVEMVEKNGSKADIPLRLIYEEKVRGKPPAECEAALNLGAPLVVVRSQNTGQLARVYDSFYVKELQKPHYCVLTFDGAGLCARVDLVAVQASQGTTAY